MFIRFLKSNNATAFVFIPLIAGVIWAFGFISPAIVPVKHSMPLYELIAGAFTGLPWLGIIISFLLIIGEAFLINHIVNENEVLPNQSSLPGLFYVLFMSNNNAMLVLHPLLFANLFILFAINKLLCSYRKEVAFAQAFDAGFLISIATLFYFPYIVFLPILWIGLIIFRPFYWRDWVISFIGVLVPYLFTITIYFCKDFLDYLWFDKMIFPIIQEKPKLNFPRDLYFMLGVGLLIIFLSFGKLFKGIGEGSQKTKKGITLLIWFFFLSILSVLLAPEISTKYFSALAIPVSVFSANYFLNTKKQWWGEVLFLLLVISIFYDLAAHFF